MSCLSDHEWFVLQENDLLVEELIHRSHQSGDGNSSTQQGRVADDDVVLMRPDEDRVTSPRHTVMVK